MIEQNELCPICTMPIDGERSAMGMTHGGILCAIDLIVVNEQNICGGCAESAVKVVLEAKVALKS